MKAIILEEPKKFKYIDINVPKPPNTHEVTLKIKRLGVCGTDLHAYNGKQPFFSYPRMRHRLRGSGGPAPSSWKSHVLPW